METTTVATIPSSHFEQGARSVGTVRQAFEQLAVTKQAFYQAILTPTGVTMAEVPGRSIIVNRDNKVHNVVKASYAVHQYDVALVDPVQALVEVADGAAAVQAFGWSDGGGSAWINVALTEPVRIGGADVVLPGAFVSAHHNGSYATAARLGNFRMSCTNQLPSFHRQVAAMTIRHTSRSEARLADLRVVLAALYDEAAALEQFGNRLAAQPVTSQTALRVFDVLYPRPEGDEVTDRKVNSWARQRAAFSRYAANDPAVVPFADNAWGVYQAFNGFHQHHAPTRTDRNDRTVRRFLSGELATVDTRTLATIARVVDNPTLVAGLN